MVIPTLRYATDEEIAQWDAEAAAAPKRRKPQVQCSCGRFAKFIRVRHWYNGSYNCETLEVHCSRCGDVGIEMV
jgi:hypothetical protein